MAQHSGHGPRRGHSGGHGRDLSEELFGRGALRRADPPPKSRGQDKPVPWWVRLGALSAATGAGGHVASTWALPAIPPGGSRDELRAALEHAVTYAPPTSIALAGGAAVGAGWWVRHARAQRRDERLAKRRKEPSAADRAATMAVKLPAGSVQADARRSLLRRRVRRVDVRAPAGALLDNPSRAWCEALSAVLGVGLRPQSWAVATGRAVLVPGELPPVDPDVLPPVATDPVGRAEQVLHSMLGKAADAVETEVIARHDDGTPREFTLRHAPTPKLAAPERRELFGELAGDMLSAERTRSGRGYHVVPDPANDLVRFIEKPPMDDLIPRPVYDERAVHGDKLLLTCGQDEHGTYVGWDVSVSTLQPHGLLVGPTGLGKTSLMRSLIVSATRLGAEVRAADPKKVELKGLTSWPGCTVRAASVDDIRSLLSDLHDEMDRRYNRIERTGKDPRDLQPIITVLDEYYILRTLLQLELAKEGKKGTPEELQKLVRMLAMARTARIHLLIGIQRADSEGNFPDGSRDNATFRVSLGPQSLQAAGMIWPSSHRMSTRLPLKHGHGLISGQWGEPTVFQGWWTPTLEDSQRVRDRMPQSDRDLIDSLRPTPAMAAGTWNQPTAPAPEPEPVPGSPEAALAGVREIIRAGVLLEHMRVRVEDDGDYVDVTVEHLDQPTPDVILADLRMPAGYTVQRQFDGDEEVWLLDDTVVAT